MDLKVREGFPVPTPRQDFSYLPDVGVYGRRPYHFGTVFLSLLSFFGKFRQIFSGFRFSSWLCFWAPSFLRASCSLVSGHPSSCQVKPGCPSSWVPRPSGLNFACLVSFLRFFFSLSFFLWPFGLGLLPLVFVLHHGWSCG